MIDYGMVWWHLIGFVAVVTVAMWVLKIVLPGVQGFARVVLFGIVVAGTWFAHSNYYIQSGPFLRDTIMVPVLGKRPPAERLAYVLEAKAWAKPEVRRELQSVSVLERPAKALELANRGIPLLGDTSQMRWLHLAARLTELGQPNECSILSRNELTADVWFRMLNRLTEAEIKDFYNLSLEAVVNGITPPAIPAVSPIEPNAFIQSMLSAMPPHDQTRFKNAAMAIHLRGGTSPDACWFAKTLFASFERLPYASRVAVLQNFAGEAHKGALKTAQLR